MILQPHERITVQQYNEVVKAGENHLLIDVRPDVQFGICSLPNSMHIPIDELEKRTEEVETTMREKNLNGENSKVKKSTCFYFIDINIGICIVFVVCRLGNDSQLAVRMLEAKGINKSRDIIGGLLRWSTKVDESFPIY